MIAAPGSPDTFLCDQVLLLFEPMACALGLTKLYFDPSSSFSVVKVTFLVCDMMMLLLLHNKKHTFVKNKSSQLAKAKSRWYRIMVQKVGVIFNAMLKRMATTGRGCLRPNLWIIVVI